MFVKAARVGTKQSVTFRIKWRTSIGIEAGKLDIRPGLSNVLKAMSRIAPQFMLKQMAKVASPKMSPVLSSKESRPHRNRWFCHSN